MQALGPHSGLADDALSDTGQTTSHFGPNFPFSDIRAELGSHPGPNSALRPPQLCPDEPRSDL